MILSAKHALSWSPKETRIGQITQPVAVRSELEWYLVGRDRENESIDIGGHVSDPKDENDSADHCQPERDGKVDRLQRRNSDIGIIDKDITPTSVLSKNRGQGTENRETNGRNRPQRDCKG